MATHSENSAVQQPDSARNPYYDALRGVAMLFVIVVHMMHQQDYIGYNLLMASFYVNPMFFLVSGFLLSPATQRDGFGKFVGKRALGLLVPYLIFFGVSLLWTNTVKAYFAGAPMFTYMKDMDWPLFIRALLFSGEFLYDCPVVPAPLWFLYTMFFTSVLFYLTLKIKNKLALGGIALLLIAVTPPIQTALAANPVWMIRQLPVSLFFMLCGHFMRQLHGYIKGLDSAVLFRDSDNTSYIKSVLCTLGGLLLGAWVLRLVQMGRGDMHAITSPWYFAGGLAFTGVWMLLLRSVGRGLLSFIGQNSLYYLAINGLVLGLPFIEHIPAQLADRAFDGLSIFIIYFMICLVLITAAVIVAVTIKRLVTTLFATLFGGRATPTASSPSS